MSKAATEHGSRLSKDDLKHDTLVETAVKVESYYDTHKQTVWMIGGGLIAVIVAILGINTWMGSSSKQASFDLMQAKTSYGMQQLGDAQTKFQQVLSNYGGTTAAEAQYYMARIKFDQGDFTGAKMGFESCLKDYSPDAETTIGAEAGLAATMEVLGQLDEAAAKFIEIADKNGSSPFAPEALTQAARIYTKSNQLDKAKTALERIVKNYPDSQNFQRAKQQFDALR